MAKHNFRFFNMPRELRDEVYDQLYKTHTYLGSPACKIRVPIQNMRLVSRRFRTEYSECASRFLQHFQVFDNEYRGEPDLPARASDPTTLDFYLSILAGNCSCDVSVCQDDVQCQIAELVQWITAIIQGLHHLRQIFITIRTDDPQCLERMWVQHHNFEKLPMVEEIRTACCPEDPDYDDVYSLDEPCRVVAKWKQGGVLRVDQAAVEQCQHGEY